MAETGILSDVDFLTDELHFGDNGPVELRPMFNRSQWARRDDPPKTVQCVMEGEEGTLRLEPAEQRVIFTARKGKRVAYNRIVGMAEFGYLYHKQWPILTKQYDPRIFSPVISCALNPKLRNCECPMIFDRSIRC